MDSSEISKSPVSETTRAAESCDDFEPRKSLSSLSSDVAFRDIITANFVRNVDHVSQLVSPRSSFSALDDQFDYFKQQERNDAIHSLTHDLENLKFGSTGSKVNSSLFPEGKSNEISRFSENFAAGSDKNSFIGVLKAASVDAYDSSNSAFLKFRKAASQDAYDSILSSPQLFPRVLQSGGDLHYDGPMSPSLSNARRESFPNRMVQSRQAPFETSPEMPSHGEISWQANNSVSSKTSSPSLLPLSPTAQSHSYNYPSLPHHGSSMESGQNFPPVNNTNMVYQVQFKRRIRHFITGPMNQHLEIHVGDFVKVEADRGEDLGVVQGIITIPSFLELRRQHHSYGGSIKDDDGAWDLKHILRMASTYERRQLPIKSQEEVQVVQNAFEMAQNVYGLPMSIIDAEYQFDHHKLTIYYESNKRIDFREFVRDMFALYKTRIWMQQVDASESLLSPMTPHTPTKLTFSPQHFPLPHGGPPAAKGRIPGGIASVPVPTLRQPPFHISNQGYHSSQYAPGGAQNAMMRIEPPYTEPAYYNNGYDGVPSLNVPSMGYHYDEQSQYDQQMFMYPNQGYVAPHSSDQNMNGFNGYYDPALSAINSQGNATANRGS